LGLAKLLALRNHEVTFALSKKAREALITSYGHKFVSIESSRNSEDESQFLKCIQQSLNVFRLPLLETLNHPSKRMDIKIIVDQEIELDENFGKVLDKVKPEVIILDSIIPFPSVIKSNIPWVGVLSTNPLALFKGDNLPPLGSGLSIDSPQETKSFFSQKMDELGNEAVQRVKEYMIKKDCVILSDRLWNKSPYLNFYLYNQDLDYTDEGVIEKGYFRLEGAIRDSNDDSPFTLPKSLEDKPGGLVYLSLGTLGSCDIDLMSNLVRVLSKSPHRFIVSTGPSHNQLKLGDNMWGQKYLDQIKILPHVDLVITHGGNNTFNECLYFAKPMIVIPLFYDQLDNAQRIVDKGLGIRLDTYNFKDEQLLDAIEVLMNDQTLRSKLESISQRMKSSKTKEKACDLIERLAKYKVSVYDYID